PPPGGGWGPCGSCDTCGHPANECVTSPTGECLWDPTTCGGPPPPGDDDDVPPGDDDDVPPGDDDVPPDDDDIVECYRVSVSYSPASGAYGTASIVTPQNCQGGYLPGTSVTIQASPSGGGTWTDSWSGSCSGLAIPGYLVNSQTVTVNFPCTVHVNFAYLG
ncbi:MAG: hypothetical protein GYB65_21705, partial [Chloroflexi bacterium]|nr:hypothetical protein [Chloroflexota bacterium]